MEVLDVLADYPGLKSLYYRKPYEYDPDTKTNGSIQKIILKISSKLSSLS